jgi:hypothetical protein
VTLNSRYFKFHEVTTRFILLFVGMRILKGR